MAMYKIRARATDSNIRTMEGMLLENRVMTVPALFAANRCNGTKWEVCIQASGKSRFITLKARGSNGFSQVEQVIPIGADARQVRASDLSFGMKIEPGEVVTPLENSPFAVIYRPLLFGEKEAASKLLCGKPAAWKPFPIKIVENPVVELPVHLRRV